jgi:hypothetical protein
VQLQLKNRARIVNEEFATFATQPERPTPLSRLRTLSSDTLDSFSFALFCVSVSSLTLLLSSWCSRFLAKK